MIFNQMFALVVRLAEMSSFWIVADGQPCFYELSGDWILNQVEIKQLLWEAAVSMSMVPKTKAVNIDFEVFEVVQVGAFTSKACHTLNLPYLAFAV